MEGILTVAANTNKRNAILFKRCTTIQLYPQTNFHGGLKMTVNKRAAISPVLAVGVEKFFCGQMQNYLENLKMVGWNNLDTTCKINELFSSAGLASQVL